MHPTIRLAGVLTATAVLAACSAQADPSPSASTAPVSTSGATVHRLGAGFYNSRTPPPPEGTVTPRPGSWSAVHPPRGYRVVLLSTGTDRPTRTLTQAVQSWAAAERARLTTSVIASAARLVPSISSAIATHPDLIVSVGDDLVDALATVTASALQQQFLVVGAELAEPTGNVTAADWRGASYRGEGLGTPTAYDPSSFTEERAGRAVRAGVAAVLNDLTGIVVSVR